MAFFYTGPVTDGVGLWTEIGYLGNNSLNSVTTGSTGPTGLNLYAYDEYRLSTGYDLGPGSFIGMSIGNEVPNVVTQWVFPAGLPDMWGNGQGGTGRFKEIMAVSFHGLFQDRYWAQVGFVSGLDNINWSDGSNIFTTFAYNMFRETRNDLWFAIETFSGKDIPTQMTSVKNSYICPGTCPTGVTDSTLSITNSRGGTNGIIVGAPVVKIKDFTSYKLRVEHSVADRGPHSWIASAVFHSARENIVGGGKVERDIFGVYARYFYQRTYGFYTTWWRDLKYDYTNAAGLKRSTYQKDNFSITLLWVPAMNFSTHLVLTPKTQNRVFEDQKNPNLLFVGNDTGVFASLDRGAHWVKMNNNFPNIPIRDIIVHPRQHDLILGSYGRGIFVTNIEALEQLNDAVLVMGSATRKYAIEVIR